MTTTGPLTAFFGATGGCGLAALTKTLNAGYRAVARKSPTSLLTRADPPVARKPSKLTDLLTSAPHSIPQSKLDSLLTIYPGSATDLAAVKALFAAQPVDLVVFSIGSAPAGVQLSLRAPIKMEQPTVCADAAGTIIQALSALEAEGALQRKPFFVAISSTGVKGALGEHNVEDVPLLMAPLYHLILTVPHRDKHNLETTVADEGDKEGSVLSGWAVVRPTLLTDGAPLGDKIRVGWRDRRQGGPGPEKGYLVSRGDVGGFIFEKMVREGGFGEWNGRVISLAN